MTVTAESERLVRAPLSRQQVLRAALEYVDEHGLEALSMHKLGAALGVKAMSLYKHVADKDDGRPSASSPRTCAAWCTGTRPPRRC